MWSKDWYHDCIAKHLCTRCAIPLEEGEGRRQCAACREKKRKQRQRWKQEYEREEQKKSKKKTGYTLDELAIMARERGISYGQLVLQMESATERNKKSQMPKV